MVILLVLIPAVLFIAVILLIARHNQKAATATGNGKEPVNLKWRYLAAPSALFIISVILGASFYSGLSPQIAWHFTIDGSPDRWLEKAGFIAGVLVLQLVLMLIGLLVVILTSRSLNAGQALPIKKESMLTFMGNVPAVIQVIIGFMMIDDFSYNLTQKHLLPLWIVLITILVLATFALIAFFIIVATRMNRQYDVKEIKDQKLNVKNAGEKPKINER